MGAVLRFIAWVLGQVWRWGVRVVNRVVAWARNNWKQVLKWLERGVSFASIIQWILQLLGLA
ncbi:aureocin A53 family class IId bacteriocin [Microbacterium sp.]|uniref:aureocin A53 family class IId bacteriocin n=1 Tax=Microbacterium sp. TaxID=51671 RepID=UPI003342C3D4